MKIVIDQNSVNASGTANKGGGIYQDCDCDCGDCDLHETPRPDYEFTFTNSSESRDRLFQRLETFRQAPALHIQACDEMWWLACNPVGSGTVVVLDASARALLESFGSLAGLSALLARRERLRRDEEDAISLFYHTGLIGEREREPYKPQETKPRTLQAWLHVTNACNLSCQYCYVQKSKEHMVDTVAQRAIEAIFRSALKQHFKAIRVKYAGGEASLFPQKILAMHRLATQLAQQHGLDFSAYMISNGVALSPRLVEQFREQEIGITISLDGLGEYHDTQRSFASGLGSFKYVDRTIQQLLASNFLPHINVTVSQRNLAGLPALLEYILERDLPFTLSYYRENACSMHLHDLQYAEEQMIEAMRRAFRVIERHLPQRSLLGSLIDKADLRANHGYTCSAGRNYLVIDQQGGIAKCHTEMQNLVSSINEDDPLAAIQADRSDFINLPVDEKEGCRTCTWRYWCTGGCPLVTYKVTGRNDRRSPNCHIYQALFPAALRLEALRLLKYQTPIIV